MSALLLSLAHPHQCHLLSPDVRPDQSKPPILSTPPQPELRFLCQGAPTLSTMKHGRSTQTGALIHLQGSCQASRRARAVEG